MPHEAPETEEVTQTRIACDGGEGALGHPRVFLTIGPEGWVDCPYCDKRYVLKAGASGH
ncbi:MAG: zinc-finger domain-containing protein [Pseudomonadota bacterium]